VYTIRLNNRWQAFVLMFLYSCTPLKLNARWTVLNAQRLNRFFKGLASARNSAANEFNSNALVFFHQTREQQHDMSIERCQQVLRSSHAFYDHSVHRPTKGGRAAAYF
jgi:hypothetical protein